MTVGFATLSSRDVILGRDTFVPPHDPIMQLRSVSLAAFTLAAFASAHAADLTSTGYAQDFDGMGATGTAAPADWRLLVGPSGTSNSTWTNATGITPAGVAAMVASTGTLTAVTTPSGTNNNGFNAAASAGGTADRVIATSPTTVSGAAIELSLTNATGASFDALTIGYDTVRFTSVSAANELPGYALFFSLGNNVWTHVAALNPTLATVPNTVGVTTVAPTTFSLGASVAAGDTVLLRWIDDNATQTSPDQIIGLNNVTVAAVPEPETLALTLAGLGLVGAAARRRR